MLKKINQPSTEMKREEYLLTKKCTPLNRNEANRSTHPSHAYHYQAAYSPEVFSPLTRLRWLQLWGWYHSKAVRERWALDGPEVMVFLDQLWQIG